MKTNVFPRVMRCIFTCDGVRRKCPNKSKAIRNKFLQVAIQPKLDSPVCRRCEYYLGFQRTEDLEYIGCSWLSDKEKSEL